LDKVLLYVRAVNEEINNKQINLFASQGGALPTLHLLDYPPAVKAQRLSWEKEFLGLYVSEHPFSEFLPFVKNEIIDLIKIKNGEVRVGHVLTAGVVTDIEKIITSKGDPMLFVKIEDNQGGLEMLVFPKLYQEVGLWLAEEKVILVDGQISEKDAEPKILANMIWEINEDNVRELIVSAKKFQPTNFQRKKVIVRYPAGATPELAEQVKGVFKKHPGQNIVFLKVENKLIKTAFSVKFCQEMEDELVLILGKQSVILK
jgi:DNA polymerase-3 subunit alpha